MVEAVTFEDGDDACFQGIGGAGGGKTKIEIDVDRTGNHIKRAGAAMNIRYLEIGRAHV